MARRTVGTNPERWLNSVAPRTTARTTRETASLLTSVPKENRHTLTGPQKIKLQAKCKEGLPEPHFDFLASDPSSDLTSLKGLYSVRMKVEELKQSLMAEDMHGIFVMPDAFAEDPTGTFNKMPAAGCASVDMFTNTEDVDLETCKEWSKFLSAAGEQYLVENLLWSGMKLKNSLSNGLKEKLIEKTLGWPVTHQTGVVYLKLVMTFITASTPKSTRLLINKLQELGVRDYKGENVRKCCSTIKGAYEILHNKKAVPYDFLDLVFDVLEKCSVDKFVTYIRGICKNLDQRVKVIDLNYLLTGRAEVHEL